MRRCAPSGAVLVASHDNWGSPRPHPSRFAQSTCSHLARSRWCPSPVTIALPASRRREASMLAKVFTGAVVGMDGALVEVEVDIAQSGLPNFLIVGLPDAAVQEARERVRAAIRNPGISLPTPRITV